MVVAAPAYMQHEELQTRIKELERQLSGKEAEYTIAVRTGKNYNTLRALREEISNLKKTLQSLYNSTHQQSK